MSGSVSCGRSRLDCGRSGLMRVGVSEAGRLPLSLSVLLVVEIYLLFLLGTFW